MKKASPQRLAFFTYREGRSLNGVDVWQKLSQPLGVGGLRSQRFGVQQVSLMPWRLQRLHAGCLRRPPWRLGVLGGGRK